MKKIKYLVPILALSLFSCSDFLDVNESPNNAIGSQITPNLNIAAAQLNSYRPQATAANRLGNLFMNNWAFNVNAFAVTAPEEFSLEFDNTFYSGIWDATYRATADYSLIIDSKSLNYENHKAIAKIMKSYHFQTLVDLYGDIPYFEAHKGIADVTPAYTDDKLIYRDLVKQLEEAIAIIDNPKSTTIPVGSEDIILAGDMAGWKRLANTVKLRILLRQCRLTDAETVAYLTDKFASIDGATFVNSNVTINPGFSNGSAITQNPFYAQFYAANETTQQQLFNFIRASKYMGDKLNFPVDPRGSRLFALVGGTVKGCEQGDKAIKDGGTAPALISSLGTGIVTSSAQVGYIMSLAESLFLQAEAVNRGYLTSGSASLLFNAGITASCAQLGVTPAATTAYVTAINTGAANIGRGYTNSVTQADRIAAIMYQKNIALQGATNAIESFIDHTRTGVTVPLAGFSSTSRPNKPRLLLYPNSEQVANAANIPVPARTLASVFTTGPFWFVP